MYLEKEIKDLLIGSDRGVVGNLDGFGVPGVGFVGWIFIFSTGIAGLNLDYSR